MLDPSDLFGRKRISQRDVRDAQERTVLDRPRRGVVLAVVAQTRTLVVRMLRRPAAGPQGRRIELARREDVVAVDAVHHHRKVDAAAVRQREIEAGREVGIGIADDRAPRGIERAVGIQTHVIQLARTGVGARPVALRRLDDTVDHVSVERIDGVADGQHVEEGVAVDTAAVLRVADAVGVDRGARIFGRADRHHLVAVAAEDARGREVPVGGGDDAARQCDLEALVADLAVVDPHRVETRTGGQILLAQQIGGALDVIVERQREAPPEDREVEADVHLRGFLPRKLVVGHTGIGHEAVAQTLPAVLIADAVGAVLPAVAPVVVVTEPLEGLVGQNALVARHAVAGA